jgi:hypothetical protein
MIGSVVSLVASWPAVNEKDLFDFTTGLKQANDENNFWVYDNVDLAAVTYI